MDGRQFRRPLLRVSLALVLFAAALAARGSGEAQARRVTRTLRVLTYNVAGLPEGLSRSRPSVSIPLIGPLLSPYDLALVQEDFAYQRELRRASSHPYRTLARSADQMLGFGDGLSRFSRHSFASHERVRWRDCNGVTTAGSDCLTPKGFTFARHRLARGRTVDVYNVHLDAGSGAADRQARRGQLGQLAKAIDERSAGHAVIVAGDTNLRRGDSDLLSELLGATGLADACSAAACRHRIDKVLFRSGDRLRLSAVRWEIDRRFVADGRPLSDHQPVAVLFWWQ
jgi:endonuclease/exonuclease/phosphatase (EEP) superfamily protein YafD